MRLFNRWTDSQASLRPVKYIHSRRWLKPPRNQELHDFDLDVDTIVLGIGGYNCRPSLFQSWRRDNGVQAILWNLSQENPSLTTFPDIMPTAIWSDSPKVGYVPILMGQMALEIYDFSVNDLNLLGSTTSHWTAIIDLAGPGLKLPPFLLVRQAEKQFDTLPQTIQTNTHRVVSS